MKKEREEQKAPNQYEPPKKVYYERIGDHEWPLELVSLQVNDEVVLWELNPRIRPSLEGGDGAPSEDRIAAELRRKGGYDVLRNSIRDQGQMNPIYVWKSSGMKKYIIIEGNTRVTCKRELLARDPNGPDANEHAYVDAKVLPEEFSREDRVLLLVGIHVRGSGVRSWDRWVQAQVVHEAVTPQGGQKPLTTMTKLAGQMGKSISTVSRLLSAYKFAEAYVDHFDSEDAPQEAVRYFSILEEISRSTGFGPMVRDLENPEYDDLRREVFDMVRHGVFKEYRDARYIQQFHEDADKWEQLKTHEAGIANKLAAQVKAGTSNVGTRIHGLTDAIKRTLLSKPEVLGEEHLDALHEATQVLSSYHTGASAFRLQMGAFKRSLQNVKVGDLQEVHPGELLELVENIERVVPLAGGGKA